MIERVYTGSKPAGYACLSTNQHLIIYTFLIQIVNYYVAIIDS